MANTLTTQQAMGEAARLFAAGDLQTSEALCRRILEAAPGYHPAYYQIGLIAVQAGNMPAAASMVARAAQLDPASAVYHRSLGEICRRLGRLDDAIAHGRQAVALAPTDAEGFYNLGIALADSLQWAEAEAQYRRALALQPRHNYAANNLGSVLEKLGREDEALRCYESAVAIDPRHAEAQNNLGAILLARGDVTRAQACFDAALASAPDFVHAHYNLSSLKKYAADDPRLAQLENLRARAHHLPPDAAMRLWFAIGKGYEDTARYDEAFDAYQKGNQLKRATFHYDEAAFVTAVDDIIRRFDTTLAVKIGSFGCRDETPVFILGMPRSGSTLAEQILSSHPGIHGAGELLDFSQLTAQATGNAGEGSYMDWLLDASDENLARLGENYIARLRRHHPSKPLICDKMPGNFFYAGLIRLALPRAKIVHTPRDAMDTCFSNYARLFNETMPFAYDLGELGRYYRQYQRLMDHWRRVLPAGSILDLHYEDVVADLDGQARRLISFTGVDWDDACLDFHRNTRPVRTASVAQVRKPVYKTSVARWKNFTSKLEPLKNTLEGN